MSELSLTPVCGEITLYIFTAMQMFAVDIFSLQTKVTAKFTYTRQTKASLTNMFVFLIEQL